MRSAVVDTNVLVYDAFTDQPLHGRARSLLDSLESWVIPTIVLVELAWFARGAGLPDREARRLVLGYALSDRAEVVEVTADDLVDALASAPSMMDLEDELILCVAERLQLPLATFDSRLRERARERGIPLLPGEEGEGEGGDGP